MFVVSAKLTPVKLLAISAAVCTLVLGGIYLALPDKGGKDAAVESGASLKVSGEEDVRSYLASYGWEVSEKSEESKVTIPEEWTTTFENYNAIQKLQGFDLKKYRGKEVTRFTFEITNYPDENETVLANVLVSKERIIGGDISTARADGYMHGFKRPDEETLSEYVSLPTDASGEALPAVSDPIPEK